MNRNDNRSERVAALIVPALILLIFGLGGLALHVLWYLLISAFLVWLIGFFIRDVEGGGRRRWYGRS